jgi:hypothetical protein
MPAIQAQAVVVNPDGVSGTLTLVTSGGYGTLTIDLALTGSGANTTALLTLKRGGVQIKAATLNNVTAAAVENWCATAIQDAVDSSFQFRAHAFTLSPLTWTILCANLGYNIPAVWW